MQYRVAIGMLVAFVILAGCVAAVGGAAGGSDRPDAAPAAPTATPAAADAEGAASPPVVVAVAGDGRPESAEAHVRNATDHWGTANDGRPFALASSAPAPADYPIGDGLTVEPDVVVRFANRAVSCEPAGPDPAHYCTEAAGEDAPATATISPGLTEAGYESATAAALGRLTGHGDAAGDLPAPAFADPWPANDTVTVTIENEANPDRDVEPLVAETLRWWEANDERWGNYTTDWRLVDDPDADVTVALVDRVQRCGGHADPGSLLGCAPVLHPENLADERERVRIRSGYTDETTLRVLKHEFGHVYGRSHGMAPEDLMAARLSTTRRADPDATE